MFAIGSGTGRGARRVRASGLGMVVLMLVCFQGLGAQDKEQSSKAAGDKPLLGTVVDARTGTPLVGAFVRVEGDEWGTLSGADGSFALPRIEVGRTSLVVEQLGYRTLQQSVEVKEPREAVALSVEPDSTLLEGINLVLDRFEQRRNSAATTSWVFNREDLVTTVGVSALGFLKARAPINLIPCSLGTECAVFKGRVTPVTVYVDEMQFLGGMDYLSSHQPYDLQRIEVFAGGRQIRVYTEGYLKRAGKIRLQPNPFII
jgi:hypothetical protein